MAKKTDDLSPAERRKFKTDLAKLKKAGLIRSSVNVRGAKPTKHYRELITENRGILDGRERAVKVPRSKLETARDSGMTVRNGRIIIQNNPGMRVLHDKNDPFGYRLSQPAGFQMVEHRGPEPGKPLEAYEATVNAAYQKGDLIGFTVEGHRSTMLFSTPAEAFKQFKQFYLSKLSRNQRERVMSGFTIYRVPKSKKWQWREGKPVRMPKAKRPAAKKPKKKAAKKPGKKGKS